MKTKVSKKIKTTTTTEYHTASNVARKASEYPSFESNGQSLEQEHRLSYVFRGCSDAWISSMADWFQVPAVSTASEKM